MLIPKMWAGIACLGMDFDGTLVIYGNWGVEMIARLCMP